MAKIARLIPVEVVALNATSRAIQTELRRMENEYRGLVDSFYKVNVVETQAVVPPAEAPARARKTRKLRPEARRNIVKAQKERWARLKAEKQKAAETAEQKKAPRARKQKAHAAGAAG